MFALNKNGFLMTEALFALFILLLCISILWNNIEIVFNSKGWIIDEKINKEWFYHD